MSETRLPRILCIMGSGETAPTMVSVHAELIARLGPPPVPAVLLDTPFGFQENADDVAERAVTYFRRSVGAAIEVTSFRDAAAASSLEHEAMLAQVRTARYVFSGPGSPTYALAQWRETSLPAVLEQKLRAGGCVTFASAAACTLGAFTAPVYEMYKVGQAPHWHDGLDVLRVTGLQAAVIPHYNNAEGGTHDTRYCYIGERRLRVLEQMLPDGAGILGVDEHTACIIDLDDGTLAVRGRGVVTWRCRGESRTFASGSVTSLRDITAMAPDVPSRAADGGAAPPQDAPAPHATPFSEEVERQLAVAGTALERHDARETISALLAVETQLHAWQSDTLDSDEQDEARASMRGMLIRLGDAVGDDAETASARISTVVERLLVLRQELRASGDYALADRVRDALVEAGVEVRDSRDGAAWELSGSRR